MPDRVPCVWCETELALEDAKPIKYARIPELPDEENMQCKDHGACTRRQDALDAAQRARMEQHGMAWW